MLRRAAVRAAQLACAAARRSEGVTVCREAAALQQVAEQPLPRHYSTNSHDIFNVHYDEPHNNLEVPFDFTDSNYEIVADIMSRYPTNYKQSAVIPLLDLAQKQNGGWLSLNAMNRVAKVLEMAPIRVYEVATFYTMFNRSKIGKYHVMVCGTTPCMLQGARTIYKTITDHLGIHYGETTEDGMFTLSEMECMGSCVNAPMITIADYSRGVEGFTYNYYEDLTPEDTIRVLEMYKSGKIPEKVGSQHRDKAEPAGAIHDGKWVPKAEGQTTLTWDKPPGPYCRDLPPMPEPEQKAAEAGKK